MFEVSGMEPFPSFLPHDLLVELELCVSLHNFVNIDLHNQGWYAVRVRPVADGGWIELPVFGVSQNDAVDKVPLAESWLMEEGNRAFRSRLIRVKYCLEEAPLGHAISFHLLHPLQEGLDGVACTLEFELLFQLADVTRKSPCPKAHHLKSVAREFIRISGVHRGVHEYCNITFDEDHFALCNATVHSRLVSVTSVSGLQWHCNSNTRKALSTNEPARTNSFTLFAGRPSARPVPTQPGSGRSSPGSPRSSASNTSSKDSFSKKRVGESDEAVAAMHALLLHYLTPQGDVDDEFMGQVHTLYAASTGILARSSESLNRWVHSLPKACFSPLTLEKVRKKLQAQQGSDSKPAAANEPQSFAERGSGLPSHLKTADSHLPSTRTYDPALPAAMGMLSAPPALVTPVTDALVVVSSQPTVGSHYSPPSPLEFWEALPQPYSAAVAVSRLVSIWQQCLTCLHSDWGVLAWLLCHPSTAEMVKVLKGQWEQRQFLECSHWLVHGGPGAEEVPETPAHMPAPSTPWKMSLNGKHEVRSVRHSLKSGMNLTVPRVHKPAVWDFPHRNPLLVVDSSLAEHMPEAPARRSLPDADGKDGPADAKECWVAVFVHGFQGASTDLCLVKAQMQLLWPKLEVLSSKANEDKTFDSIESMGKRLAKEMSDFLSPFANSYRRPLGRIIIVGHSIGNLIVRAALTCPDLQPYLQNLWLYISISGPHLGWIYNNNKLMDTGVGLLKVVSGGKSLSELTFTDHKDMKDCYLYKLAHERGLQMFPYVIIMSSPQDKYIPLHSAQIAMCETALKDPKKGKHYAEMINAMMDGIGQPGATQLFRVDVEFRYRKTEKLRFGNWLGRTAHIDFIETDMYVRFLLWGLLWRYKLMPESNSTWV